MSHPVWVRGLKLPTQYTAGIYVVVAWIETGCRRCKCPSTHVALCVGAWIETSMITMQGTTQNVAPCVGAWIETCRKWKIKRVNEDGKFVYPLLNH